MVSHGAAQPWNYVALLQRLAQQFDTSLVALAVQADHLRENELEVFKESVQSGIGGRG